MALVTTNDQHYKDIAAAIKANAPMYIESGIKPEHMAAGVIDACYNANLNGFHEGEQSGELQGIDQGKQMEARDFWAAFQQNGKRTDYSYAFRTAGWSDKNFKPHYDITAEYCIEMFRNSDIVELAEILRTCGVKLQITSDQLYYFAYASDIKEFPELGLALSNIQHAFNLCKKLEKIAKLNLYQDGFCSCKNAFSSVPNLVYLRFNDRIAPESLNLSSALKLDRASFASTNEDGLGYGLIPALSDSVSGTVTVSAEAVAAAFPNRAEWEALCETKPTWTITEV